MDSWWGSERAGVWDGKWDSLSGVSLVYVLVEMWEFQKV